MERISANQIHFYTRLKPSEFKMATHFALVPSKDMAPGWEDIVYLREPIVDFSGGVRPSEYVYILVNRSIPNMVKIGMTTRTVDKRVREINKATGVPTPWVSVWSFRCFSSMVLEGRVHEHLAKYRVNEDREMFAVDSVTAQQVIEELGKDFTNVLLAGEIERNSHLEPPADTAPTLNHS
jgi:hypothetical protein